MKRYLTPYITADLKKKMVFIGGPRQVGKTTLSRDIAQEYSTSDYLNWDNGNDKKRILQAEYHGGSKLIIFDEIHKFSNWKNFLKGEYDTKKHLYDILVTGSARLDLYQKGGDSLLGRYFYFRLHPFSLAELAQIPHQKNPLNLIFSQQDHSEIIEDLLQFGSFPEVFLSRDIRDVNRWGADRERRLVTEDIRDVSTIRDLGKLGIIVALLPDKVGSLFSINSLVEDLQVTHKTLGSWMDTLEQMYYSYRITPYHHSHIVSLRKEPKIYLWDYSRLTDTGAKKENLIANHLLKYAHFLRDVHGIEAELTYVRDREQREVDFCLCVDGKPFLLVEVKSSGTTRSPHLIYFTEKIKPQYSFQITFDEGIDREKAGIRLMSASKFLSALV